MEEEEMAERTRKERAEIVKKYDIGREEGAVIDPWEDPDFEVCMRVQTWMFPVSLSIYQATPLCNLYWERVDLIVSGLNSQ